MGVSLRALLAVVAALALAPAAGASPPVPPDQIALPGVLVDGSGVPRAGPVDLTARIYDAASGGALIYKQAFAGVPLADGHYSLPRGPTDEASDASSDPLTTSLRTALTGRRHRSAWA